MNERTVIDYLALQNTWWFDVKDFPFGKINDFKRSDYFYLSEHQLPAKEASVIIGPRGVGKSTVLFEIMRLLLGFPDNKHIEEYKKIDAVQGVEGRRILYASFEDPSIQKLSLLDMLRIYARYVLKEDISKLSKQTYVFFDEIQNVVNWGDQIKSIQDLQYPIKFFITGSSSTAMLDESSKATRRVSLYRMHPLKFMDFLKFKISDDNFNKVCQHIKVSRQMFFKQLQNNDAQQLYDLFLQLYNDLKPWQTKIQLAFEEYSIKGGYPELLELSDYMKCAEKLSQQFWLGFHKDLVLAKGIGDPSGMKDLATYIASISSLETNYTSLMDNSKVVTNTGLIKKYLYHLQCAFLINESVQFAGNVSKRRSVFKIYMTDVAVRNMLRGFLNELLLKNDVEYGFTIETLVFDHVLRMNHKIRPHTPLSYWKDARSGHEVDIVVDFGQFVLALEVKKADNPSFADVPGLKKFCASKRIGVVTCGKKLALENNIVFVPHWLFILLC